MEYYETTESVVRTSAHRHATELKSDGLKIIKGKELKTIQSQGSYIMQLPDKATVLALWTPRSALRLGMVLRDSTIADIGSLWINGGLLA